MELGWKNYNGIRILGFEVKDYSELLQIWNKMVILADRNFDNGSTKKSKDSTIDYSKGYFLFTDSGCVYHMTQAKRPGEYSIYKPCIVKPDYIGIIFTDTVALERDFTTALKTLEQKLLYIDQQ